MHSERERDEFFASVISGEQCDVNWYEGGLEDDRPRFAAGAAPALLGLDSSIWEWCSAHGGTWGDAGYFGPSLAHRCVEANENILRMVNRVWNMCVNLRWVLCALSGKLPGQRGRDVHFALAPSELDWAMWNDVSRAETQIGEPGVGFAVSDVYFAELSIIHSLCANRQQMLGVRAGEVFRCELDRAAYDSLVAALVQNG